MRRLLWVRALIALGVLTALVGGFAIRTQAARATPSSCAGHVGASAMTGTIGGAAYIIEMPASWNGTLLLYSHGYVFPPQDLGQPNPAADVGEGDPATGGVLLSQGFALAGSSYSQAGWALQQAFHDQIALLDFFDSTCGRPSRTIAWGHSLGGIITAGLTQLNPNRFAGALPMCGVLAGGVGTWNQALDGSFAFKTLLAPSLPIVNLPSNPAALSTDLGQALGVLGAAQGTAQGQARIALIAALGDVPGWYSTGSPEPAATDYAAQEANQYAWENFPDFLFAFFGRADLEARAGGNPSWNTGVNYHTQLANSADLSEVTALYAAAGLSLNDDLNALDSAPRIAANPNAVRYLSQYITFNGNVDVPVLTMHTTGDGLVVNQDEQSYAQVVGEQSDASLLRQVFVHRAGHCAFTPAETLTALQTLLHRIDTGHWGSTSADVLNQEAAGLGALNVLPPSFIGFDPTRFLRPFTTDNQDG